jgi:hypothetical protein
MQWIDKNYQPVYLIGHEPLQNGLFGIKILKRLSSGRRGNVENFVLQNSALPH